MPPLVKKVTKSIVGNVTLALAGMTILPGSLEVNSSICDGRRKNWVAMSNGILDIDALLNDPESIDDCLKLHAADWFSFSCLEFPFDWSAECPQWQKFLSDILPGDEQGHDLLRDWAGYCLTRDTTQQKQLMLVGDKRSGKGTYTRILQSLVGQENTCSPKMSSMSGNFSLQPFLNKTLAIFADARLSGRSDQAAIAETLLTVSGEDSVTVDRKGRESVTTKLDTRIMMLSNELPRFTDSSGALASRMLLIQLNESFYGREDVQLTSRLRSELPGIFKWAVLGLFHLRSRGHFLQPESSADAIADLHDIMSPVGKFVSENCIVAVGRCVAVTDIYDRWKAWCATEGRDNPGTVQTFGRDLKAAYPKIKTTRPRDNIGQRYRAFEGVGLVEGGHSDDD